MSNKPPAKQPPTQGQQVPAGAQQFWQPPLPQQQQQQQVPPQMGYMPYMQQQPGPLGNPGGCDPGRVFVDPSDPNTLHYEGFDAGARFSNLAPPRIPPPPPGVPPNPAQWAHMQGQNVVVTQRKSNWLAGGSSGGTDTGCTLQ